MPKSEDDLDAIAQFRSDILTHFRRFQTFYDLYNERMTSYRISHAELVGVHGLDFMQVFSTDLELVRQSKDYIDLEIANAMTRLGGNPNPCLQGVMNDLAANSGRFGEQFGACTRRANVTIGNGLAEIFYPTFDTIQVQASIVPLLTLGALSRGNPLANTAEIVEYLDAQYQALDIQWKFAASQLFRWETARFDIEALFYLEEMNLCLLDPLENYRNTNTYLMFRVVDECAPTS